MEGAEQKKHRKKVAGPKAEQKKQRKSKDNEDQTARQRNPKAFAIQSAVKAAKKFHRSQDIKTKKIHIPLPDRSVTEPPPVVVSIVGPPKVGKTTLLQCIVKNFTKQKLTNVRGPVTVVSGKKRRLTLIEVDNNICNMIDVAKVSDLVILVIDASHGFEMEHFEFLNILQVHGFPKVMGVLNHLDTFREKKSMRKTKKRLKDRFWTEIYEGAKLFYLSGMVHGEYQKMEIHNLCRFISVMKFRPLMWRNSHPYILADRMEDITPPEEVERNPVCDRRVTLYGYSRGVAMKKQHAIHVAGVGDFRISEIESLPDPCPTPDMEKRRSLKMKERYVFAPMSGVGGILYDKDAVYINIEGSHYEQEKKELAPAVKELLTMLTEKEESEDDDCSSIEDQIQTEDLFASGDVPVVEEEDAMDDDDDDGVDDETMADDDTDEEDSSDEDEDFDEKEESKSNQEEETDDDEEDDDDEANEEEMEEDDEDEEDESDEDDLQWKKFSRQQAEADFKKRQERKTDYMKLIYRESEEEERKEEEEEEEELGGLFRVLKKKTETDKENKYNANLCDCSKFSVGTPRNWELEEVRQLIADCFVTGRWDKSEDAAARLLEDDELYGDFEDLENKEKYAAKEEEKDDENDDDDEGSERKSLVEKKEKKKKEFDARYDSKSNEEDDFYQEWKTQMEEQSKLNRAEFENLSQEMRQNLEGFRPGLYLRVEVAGVPCEFIQHFDPTTPLVIGGVSNLEENVGYVQTRFKKHRWYKKILKTKNPVIVSLGWRRFQTIPVYSTQEHNLRHRMLKYTPEHLHCMASFWGPITPQGSGVLAVQSVSEIASGFRIAATGVVLELDKSVQIMKKLKLIGTPYKIFKKTAYIQGMFNSLLEVTKFEGAKVSTVSKVRGIIKKGARRLAKTNTLLPAGTFRATFEDRILMSDIVFLRTWFTVEVPEYYNPVTNLLGSWRAMKTTGQLRFERGLTAPQNKDSLYKPVVRGVRRTAPLIIPKALQKDLPFKVTPKAQAAAESSVKRIPVIREPKETKVARFLHQLRVVHEHRMRSQHAIMRQRAHEHHKQQAKRAVEKERKLKNVRHELHRMMGKMERAKAARERSRMKKSAR